MSLDYKPFDELDADDIIRLRENKFAEGVRYEYKMALPDKSDEQARECLFDFSSFANCAGGFVLYGVEEADRSPSGFPGVDVTGIDAHVHRIENLLRDSIRPRLPRVSHKLIEVTPGSVVLVWRIPKSFNSPHMVTRGKSTRFYSRNTVGKFPMDVEQIRSVFLRSAALGDRLRNFRLERVPKPAGNAPPLAILHVIPEAFLTPGGSVDLSQATHQRLLELRCDRVEASQFSHNFDGVVLADHEGKPKIQVYRDGTIEVLFDRVFWVVSQSGQKTSCLAASSLERAIVDIVTACLSLQDRLGASCPTWLLVSLINVRGWQIADNQNQFIWGDDIKYIDRDELLFPEVLIENKELELPKVFRSVFDQIWNSGGYPGSRNYDAEGNWKPK